MPTICVKDLAIQKRENDLVVATFGRGFYVLDDYSPLRTADPALLARESALFPVRAAWAYMEAYPVGDPGKSQQGDGFYTAPNPPFGAVFTYYLKDELKSKKDARHEAEKEAAKKGGDSFYPPWDALRAEAREEDPTIVLTVTDEAGNVVRRVTGPVARGLPPRGLGPALPGREPDVAGEAGRAVALGPRPERPAGRAGRVPGDAGEAGRGQGHAAGRAGEVPGGGARHLGAAAGGPGRHAGLPAPHRPAAAGRAGRGPQCRRGAGAHRPPQEGAARHAGRRRRPGGPGARARGAAQGPRRSR